MATPEANARAQFAGYVAVTLIFCALIGFVYYNQFPENGLGSDFAVFYSAAHMVHEGEGSRLFDIRLQQEYQQRLLGRATIPYFSPPALAALYVPTTYFPVKQGYLVWLATSLALCLVAGMLLHWVVGVGDGAFHAFMLAVVFLPVHVQLIQGQIDILVLLALLIALWAMQKGNDVAAGLVLAVALLKFQLVLPFALVLALKRRGKVIAGFAAGSAIFVLACVAVSGWDAVRDYPRAVARISSSPDVGVHTAMMANLRGLLEAIVPFRIPMPVLAGAALLLIVWTAWKWKGLEQGFALAVTTTLLVSHHLNPHSLILLLIPLSVVSRHVTMKSWQGVVALALYLPVVMAVALWLKMFALVAVLIGALGWALAFLPEPTRPEMASAR